MSGKQVHQDKQKLMVRFHSLQLHDLIQTPFRIAKHPGIKHLPDKKKWRTVLVNMILKTPGS